MPALSAASTSSSTSRRPRLAVTLIVAVLQSFTNLRQIHIISHEGGDTIPDPLFASLSSFKSLRELHFEGITLAGRHSLAKCVPRVCCLVTNQCGDPEDVFQDEEVMICTPNL